MAYFAGRQSGFALFTKCSLLLQINVNFSDMIKREETTYFIGGCKFHEIFRLTPLQ